MVTFLLPSGPKNLQSIFPGVDFTQVEEYFLEIQNQDTFEIMATTNHFKRGCCCNDDTLRLFFVNYLGGIDAVNFRIATEEHETVSSSWKKPNAYPLAKWDGGKQRFNVTSNETIVAFTTCFGEDDQDWLKELTDSPNAWIQWIGTQGQDDDYLPVLIKDGKWTTRKLDGRYEYVFQIEFEMSNDNITQRN